MEIEDNKFDDSIDKILALLEELRRLIKAKNRLNGEAILDNQDVCGMFNLTPRSLQRYRNSGELPYMRVARKPFYFESEVRRFIESKKHKKPPQNEK